MRAVRLHQKLLTLPEHVKWATALAVAAVVGFAVWVSLNIYTFGTLINVYARKQPLYLGHDYALGVLWWGVLAFGILALGGESRGMLLVAWIGKFFVILVFMLFYEMNYGLDSYHYFQLNLTGNHWMYEGYDWRTDNLIPSLQPLAAEGGGVIGPGIGTENGLRFAMLVSSITGPYFHAMKVVCAFIGLMAVWTFYRASCVGLGRSYPALFYVLAFCPSMLFWSSIVGKDPLLLLFLGLYAYGGVVWLVQGRETGFLFIGAGVLGIYLLRTWMGIMGVAALALATLLGRCRPWQINLTLLAGLPIFYLATHHILEQFHVESFDSFMVMNFMQNLAEGYMSGASAGSGTELPDIKGGASLTTAVPLVIFSGLFRPLPFDITNPFTALAALENTVALFLAVVGLFRFRMAYLRDPVVLWLGLFCLMWATLYGLIVMANFGSGVRYKLQVWPFLLILISLLTHPAGRVWLESRIPKV